MRPRTERAQMSRRRFVGSAVASGFLAETALAQTIAPVPPANPADEAARIAAGSDRAEHLTVPVKINGRGPFRFVVDTGADRTVLAADLAPQLGLATGNEVTVQGVVRSLASRAVPVSELSFGTITRRNLKLPLLPRTYMGADGYLGLDAVDGTRVTLDFENRELQVGASRMSHAPSGYAIRRPQEIYVPLRGSMGHLRSVNCRVDNVPATSFIDTGAQISVGNSKLFEALITQDTTYNILGSLPITGITGGVINARVINVRRIKLHEVIFSDAVIAFADMEIFGVWGLADTPSLLIGMNFLRQFGRVSIDYGIKEIRFNLAAMRLAKNV